MHSNITLYTLCSGTPTCDRSLTYNTLIVTKFKRTHKTKTFPTQNHPNNNPHPPPKNHNNPPYILKSYKCAIVLINIRAFDIARGGYFNKHLKHKKEIYDDFTHFIKASNCLLYLKINKYFAHKQS